MWESILERGTPPARHRVASQRFGAVLRASLRGMPKQIQRTVIVGAVAFALGWIGNVWLLAYQYDGFRSPTGSPVTGEGSRLAGSIYWVLLSAMITAVVSYRLKVGGPRFRSDLTGFPGRLKELLVEQKATAAIHLLWGACGAMLLALFTGTSLVFLGSVALVGGLASFARPFLMGLIGFVWRSVAGRIAPARKRPPAPGAMALAGAGALGAALLAGQLPGESTRVVLALAAGGTAFALGRQRSVLKAAALAMFVLLGAAAVVGMIDAPAGADDGGAIECGGSWPNNCPGVDRVFEEALLGALAALLGAEIGDAVGSAAGEDDDDDDDDDTGGMCGPPDLDEDEEYAIEWEWVDDPMPAGGTRSKKEYDASKAAERIEASRQKALAKSRQLDDLEKKVDALDKELEDLQNRVDKTLSAKPWSQLTNAEQASTKREIISTMKAQGQSQAAIERTVHLMESNPGMSRGDFMTYLLGEIVVQTPGEIWKAGSKTVAAVGKELAGGGQLLSDLGAAYMEDVASGKQAARLASPFTTAYDYYHGKTASQVQADFAEVARLTGDSSVKLSNAGAQQFINTVEAMHHAQMTGNVPAIAQPVAHVAGTLISDEILALGIGKAMKLGKAGLGLLSSKAQLRTLETATEAERALSHAETPRAPHGPEPAAGSGAGAVHPPPPKTPDNYVKAAGGTPIDSAEKLADFGALPEGGRIAPAGGVGGGRHRRDATRWPRTGAAPRHRRGRPEGPVQPQQHGEEGRPRPWARLS